MSTKFAQSKPPRKTPAVCFPTAPRPPIDPTTLPMTFRARFYLTYTPPDGPTTLDISKATLIKDPDRLYWSADTRIDGVGSVVELHYDEPGPTLTVDYYRNVPDFPETHQSWNAQVPDTLFPYYLPLVKVTDETAWTTVWGYINA